MLKPVSIPARSPLASKYLLITALLRKQFAVESTKSELGFIWVFVEPISQVLVFGILMGVILKAKTVPDIPYPFFLIIGFQLLGIFKDALNSGMNAIGSKRAFMAYQAVGTMDVFLAKVLYEFLSNSFATVIFIIAAIWWGVDISLGHLQMILFAYLGMWLLGSGCGLSLGVVTRKSMVARRIISICNRPLMFVSCVLHPYVGIEPFIREYFYWNPIVHCIEMARKSLFPHYHTLDLNLAYPWMVVIVMMGIGMSVYFNNRHAIQ
jgi:capsular polysaccharide transport system permease protein